MQCWQEGDVYAAKVVSIVDYGAYVALPSGMQALLHISELSHSKVLKNPSHCCQQGCAVFLLQQPDTSLPCKNL